jgi:ABC-2 type transport system ATP-binding protein
MAALVPAGDRALYWRLTGRQELEFFARVTGIGRADAAHAASEAASALEVEHLMDRQIGTFSTGQRRRLMVARSLVGLAPVLLLDEPYADLDETACGVVERVARTWAERGGLVIWTSPIAGGGPRPNARFRLRGGRLLDA